MNGYFGLFPIWPHNLIGSIPFADYVNSLNSFGVKRIPRRGTYGIMEKSQVLTLNVT